MTTLEIKNLHAKVEDKEILKGVNLTINSGEIHTIMGPNGTGKSTLAAIIMGNPKYEVTAGEIFLDGENITEMEVDERARAGLFLGMQYPQEISGITNADFLRQSIKSLHPEREESLIRFIKQLNVEIDHLKMDQKMSQRYLNEGFSGGEKKRNEILQLAMLEPKIAILDEIDSGLDIDALTIVGENLTKMMTERKDGLGMLLITHYQRLLNYIEPTHVHVMLGGKIVKTGDFALAKVLEADGYDTIKKELGIVDEVYTSEEKERIVMGSCSTKVGLENA